MKNDSVIDSVQFSRLLQEGDGSNIEKGTLVQGYVSIGEKIMVSDIHLNRIVFDSLVTFQGYNGPDEGITLEGCNFLGGLLMEQSAGKYLCMQECKAKHIDLWGGMFDWVYIQDVKVDGSINVSGLQLAERLIMNKVSFSRLELVHSNSPSKFIKTPLVMTDNEAAALQFRTAGIPVFISTEMAHKMIKDRMIDLAHV